MKHVKKSVLLWYASHEIYELVTDVASYPQFLPWCSQVDILSRDGDGLTARLHLAYSGIRHAFTTRNVHVPDTSVHIGLVDGPFSLLDGLWRFVPLQLPGGAVEGGASACKIEFEMRYAFSNGVLEAAISPVFDRIANTFVDSFVRRAEQVHGPGSGGAALQVAVACSIAAGEAVETSVQVEEGATVLDAVRASGLLTRFPTVDISTRSVGIWGRACELTAPVRHGDRVEIYRPLAMDPMQARRLRAAPR